MVKEPISTFFDMQMIIGQKTTKTAKVCYYDRKVSKCTFCKNELELFSVENI